MLSQAKQYHYPHFSPHDFKVSDDKSSSKSWALHRKHLPFNNSLDFYPSPRALLANLPNHKNCDYILFCLERNNRLAGNNSKTDF